MFDEPTNTDRARWARNAMVCLAQETGLSRAGEEAGTIMQDLLTYLMLLSAEDGLNFSEILGNATAQFWADLTEAGDPVPAWSTGYADFQEAVLRRANNLVALNEASFDAKEHERDVYARGLAEASIAD